jgi:hypothetical protein
VQTIPNPVGVLLLSGVSCTAANACTAVGDYDYGSISADYGTLAERWNGTTWAIQATPNPTDSQLNGVSCTSATACTAAGDYSGSSPYGLTLAERYLG